MHRDSIFTRNICLLSLGPGCSRSLAGPGTEPVDGLRSDTKGERHTDSAGNGDRGGR